MVAEAIRIRAEQVYKEPPLGDTTWSEEAAEQSEVVAASMVMLDAAVDRKIDAPYATADVVIMHSAKKGIVLNVLWQQVR